MSWQVQQQKMALATRSDFTLLLCGYPQGCLLVTLFQFSAWMPLHGPFLCRVVGRSSWKPRTPLFWVLSPHWLSDLRLFYQEGETFGRMVGGGHPA